MQLQSGWAGVFVTCLRSHERHAEHEILTLFEEYVEQTLINSSDSENSKDHINISTKIECWEDKMNRELTELRKLKHNWLQVINIKTPCVIFIRTKWPLNPVEMVQDICEKIRSNKIKRIRWSQRLTPITLTALATLPNLENLAQKVLGPYFHENTSKTFKESFFAIRPNIRNHTKMTREQIIKTVAPIVGIKHKVDLKNYDLLIMVEVFKNICGISVVRDFDKLKKLNIASIMESTEKNYEKNI
ncbi:hypothetical protein PCANB_000024 [Pneumocystis canis]|nr:hypothetical protein PCK1_000201 [Pneumocystis canis]KAG5439742.1 hypothetical protein PCANB_000024 [Pneumocystis canis]